MTDRTLSTVNSILSKDFNFPNQPIFGAVSSVLMYNGLAIPHVRLMRIYDIDENGSPVLITHTGSHKWQEFASHPYISVVIVSDNKLRQLVVNGRLELSKREKAQEYWFSVRADVRKIYDPSYQIEGVYEACAHLKAPMDVPDTFGVVTLIPEFWEVLELSDDYLESNRVHFQWQAGKWDEQRVAVG